MSDSEDSFLAQDDVRVQDIEQFMLEANSKVEQEFREQRHSAPHHFSDSSDDELEPWLKKPAEAKPAKVDKSGLTGKIGTHLIDSSSSDEDEDSACEVAVPDGSTDKTGEVEVIALDGIAHDASKKEIRTGVQTRRTTRSQKPPSPSPLPVKNECISLCEDSDSEVEESYNSVDPYEDEAESLLRKYAVQASQSSSNSNAPESGVLIKFRYNRKIFEHRTPEDKGFGSAFSKVSLHDLKVESRDKVQFIFDGELLSDNTTPQDNDMEDGDIVDIKLI
mmetsp:Transcript_14844/g.27454  ORF Transcript_14844/g.27454 Transcript_14844/m.27454 type:complete len:277 (-) Transcript_14844:27-857(-)